MKSSLLICFVGLCFWTSVMSLKICAFNIQSYGEAKASNKRVMAILIKVYRLLGNMISIPECPMNTMNKMAYFNKDTKNI